MNPTPFNDTLKLPVVAAPMFLISGPKLVTACCKNGVVGTFPALNQRTSEGFEEWLIEIKKTLADYEAETGKKAAPFGVNLIVHRTNPRVQADLELCVKHKVPIIITSLGAVSDLVDAVHSYGGLVYHDVTNKRHAEKAAEAGVDGLIAVCAGAGGHAGTVHPFVLIAEIRSFYDKTILLSGCISNGQDIAAAMQMGADLAYIGTRFINTTESKVQAEYQQMIIDCSSKDIVYTSAISGVHANFMRPSLLRAGYTEEMLTQRAGIDMGSNLTAPVEEEAKAWKTIWSAGQGVVSVNDILPTADLIERLKNEFVTALEQQSKLLKNYT